MVVLAIGARLTGDQDDMAFVRGINDHVTLYAQLSATLFVGLGIYHLLLVRQSMRWKKVIMAWALGAALFLPYAPLVMDGLGFQQVRTKGSIPTSDVIELFIPLNGEWCCMAVVADFDGNLVCRVAKEKHRNIALANDCSVDDRVNLAY